MSQRRTRPVQKSGSKNGPVVAVKPNPLAWQAALELAGGDRHRLRTDPATGEVIVRNKKEHA